MSEISNNENEQEMIKLLIIDPQNDFMDINDGSGHPALPVSGACADMDRLAKFIQKNSDSISDIMVTLDSHSVVDIAHPSWFYDTDGNHPAPFTSVTLEDFTDGKWRVNASQSELAYATERTLDYLSEVNSITIWPEHCLVGSWGHNIYKPLKDALTAWERRKMTSVKYVFKGLNPYTEHFSAVKAEVVDVADVSTDWNDEIINFVDYGLCFTYVAGEALSHCVANTVKDLIETGAHDGLVLLTDCMSPVTGFEQQGKDFINSAVSFGVSLTTYSHPIMTRE